MKKAKIYYHDIGDYLSREEKLKIIKDFGSFASMPLTELHPNKQGDWINKRNEAFDTFIHLVPEKNLKISTQSFFNFHCPGILSSRESWVYNFSKKEVEKNIRRMIDFYNQQRKFFNSKNKENEKIKIDDLIDTNPTKISWTVNLKSFIAKNKEISYTDDIRSGYLRPFMKQHIYYNKDLIERPGLFNQLIPTNKSINKIICVSGNGANKQNCVLIVDDIIDYNAIDAGAKCFPLYYYHENTSVQKGLFDEDSNQKYIRRDAISDFIFELAKKQYGLSASGKQHLSKEDIFYYVYGFLHSKEYRETFANDLKKMLPRLPLVDDVRDFWAFSKAGLKLAELHLNYEQVEPAKEVIVLYNPLSVDDTLKQANKTEMEYLNYRVEKMRFPKKGQKGSIIYNSQITIDNIPEKAYEYVVNGKSAIEWIMERYQVKTDKNSGITNDPNDWAKEHQQPRYILDLLLSIINVSVQTVDIVEGLPKVEFGE